MSSGAPIVAVGDSITWGWPEGPERSWVARVAVMLGVEIGNFGINGDTLVSMRARLPALLVHKPRAVIVTGGTNDVAMGRRVPDMCADLGAMVEVIAASGAFPVIGMPPPFRVPELERELVAFRQFIQSLAGTRHLRVIPFQRALSVDGAPNGNLFIDECHPNAEGFAAMALLVVEGGFLNEVAGG
ncbi:MAG: GDSL-type esterase/lipase family protein [Nitrospirota bacterium]|nr:GDSL-type esterase/lipase family protein [Nitrospirota bacterium]